MKGEDEEQGSPPTMGHDVSLLLETLCAMNINGGRECLRKILKLVRNLHKFKINRINRHKRAPVPVCG